MSDTLVLFLIFSFGIMTGVFLAMLIMGGMVRQLEQEDSETVEESEPKVYRTMKTKVFGPKRPNVQAAYKYSSPAYRKEREDLRHRNKV